MGRGTTGRWRTDRSGAAAWAQLATRGSLGRFHRPRGRVGAAWVHLALAAGVIALLVLSG